MIYYSPEGSFITIIALIVIYMYYKKAKKANERAKIKQEQERKEREREFFSNYAKKMAIQELRRGNRREIA